MHTSFGKRLRSIRLEKDLLSKDMAEILKVSPAFLSAVETGKKVVPQKWPDIIANELGLDDIERHELKQLARDSTMNLKIDLKDANKTQRDAAQIFARSFSNLSDEEAKSIITFLRKEN